MLDISTLVRKNIKALTPYASARDEFSGSEGVFLDANENPFGTFNRYPDPYQAKLKERLSVLKSVPAKNLFVGNGSDEVIDLLFRVFCEPSVDSALICTPTYGMYQVSAEINDVQLHKVPLSDDFQLDRGKIEPKLSDPMLKLIFLCSPNNPTGNSLKAKDIEFLLHNFNGIVVIDEAYIDFSPLDSWSKRFAEFPNLVVLQTLSKAWGLAGVRIGMAFAHEAIVQYFNKVKPPYNVSEVNQQQASLALEKEHEFEENVKLILSEKRRMESELADLKIIERIFPSDANFLLVKVADANTLYARLVQEGIIIRNRNSVVPNCVRITIGTPAENNKLLETLITISNEKSTVY